MALPEFKPMVWSKYIQRELGKVTVFEKDCDFRFEGEISHGKTVKILGLARPTIAAYTGAALGTAETLQDTSQILTVDSANCFHFTVSDLDKWESITDVITDAMQQAARGIAEARDTAIATACALGAGAASSSTAIASAANAKAAIDLGIQELWENGVSMKDKITIYLNPETYLYFKEYLDSTKTDNDASIASNVLGRYCGCDVKMSNNFYNDNTDDYLIIKTSKAVAFASGIENVETLRSASNFETIVRGLDVYGCKVVRPKELYVIKAH